MSLREKEDINMSIKTNPRTVKKFYLLEYFYVLLKSIENYSSIDKVFESFITLKRKYYLGESKYKKLTFKNETGKRYIYTFQQVLEETLTYKLVRADEKQQVSLTSDGERLISRYEKKSAYEFYLQLLPFMEGNYFAFYDTIKFCYRANPKNEGLLILPIYSPLKLNFEKNKIKTTADMAAYLIALTTRLEKDIKDHLNKKVALESQNQLLLKQLMKAGLLPDDGEKVFDPLKYNTIIDRVRKFWLTYFLKQIYNYPYSWTTFEVWAYRAKQMGLLHTTNFHPKFSGILIYPTSIIMKGKPPTDFLDVFTYENGEHLCIHLPSWEKEATKDTFVEALTDAYLQIKRSHRSYFVNLADVREIVCYKLKISEYFFGKFLDNAYKLSIGGLLNKISIALEADKLPHETNAMYLKREPVMIEGKYRNIIAINLTGAKA